MVVKINEKDTKKCAIKRKFKCKNYKNCLKETHFKTKENHIEINKVNTGRLRQKQNESIKNIKLILKTQQIFKSKKHNVFTIGVKKITLSANDNKRIPSIESVETYAYGTSKDLICKK